MLSYSIILIFYRKIQYVKPLKSFITLRKYSSHKCHKLSKQMFKSLNKHSFFKTKANLSKNQNKIEKKGQQGGREKSDKTFHNIQT